MIQGNLLELAKQGDVKAIASLINRSLQAKGIKAKVDLKNSCLQVMLESPELPNQPALVDFLKQGVTGLGASSIQRVKVYGQILGADFPAWNDEFVIGEEKIEVSHATLTQGIPNQLPDKQLSLKERAKLGDLDAITQLLSTVVKCKHITVKVNLQPDCLQVLLESEQIPEETLAAIAVREIILLKLEFVKIIRIYGRQTQADFPAWIQEFAPPSQSALQNGLSGLNLLNLKLTNNDLPAKEVNNSSTLSIQNTINEIDTKLISKIGSILGSLLLCGGIFSPIVSLPLIGNLNYLYIPGDSIIIFILSLISLILILQDKFHLLWISGIAALVVIFIGLFDMEILISQIRLGMEELLAPLMFRGLVDVAINSIQMQWGWLFLFLGAGLIIAGSFMNQKVYIDELGYGKYLSQIFDIRTEKTYLFVGSLFVGMLMIKMVFGQMNLLYTSSGNQWRINLAKQVQAQDYIKSINLSQQTFYLEHQKFAPTLSELDLDVPAETTNYKYSIVNSNETQTMAMAIAKQDGLKSYLGAVLMSEVNSGKSLIKSIFCTSNTPVKSPPENLLISANFLDCPPNYSRL